MINVLFVCLGNICRSPLAEGVFKKAIANASFSHLITCNSAGTSGWHIGEPPHHLSKKTALNHQIVLDSYGSQIKGEDFELYDYIIPLDHANLRDIMVLKDQQPFTTHKSQILLMRDFDNQKSGLDVDDPYGYGDDKFEEVYQILEESCHNLLNHIIEQHEIK